ncbi:unnamed protein product [Lymnaea stagnalis]|uniref:Uncharacterized protein n=1 Tax=Lymnaea stagnalis TaxID=6523 RepID=A0AAV2HZE4_LYMST
MIADLKEMEESGFKIHNSQIVKGSVVAIVGDNLGSHCIGFTENFSTSSHFCRYCLVDHVTFERDPLSLGSV